MDTVASTPDTPTLQRLAGPALLGLAGTLGGVAYAWLAVLSWEDVEVDLGRFFLIMSLAWGAMLGAYVTQRLVPQRCPCNHMLAWGILFRLLGVLGHPVLEDDYYRYLWDGRTFAVAGNPYADRPADHFSDTDVSAEFHRILDNINYPHIPTIYGPVCQYAFLVSYWLAPGKLLPLKLLLVGADLLTLWCLLQLSTPLPVLLYAWCPLLMKETAFTAHPDTLGVAFLVAALYCCTRQRHSMTAILAALAVGTRLPAVLLVPLVLRQAGAKHWALFGGSLLAVYLPFWSQESFGTLRGMAAFFQDWEFNSSGYAVLAAWLGSHTARLLGAGLFGAFYLRYLWVYYRQTHLTMPRGDWIYGMFLALSPVLNPWYVLWLLPFVVLFPSYWGVTALAAVSVSYAHGLYVGDTSLLPYAHPVWVRPVEFGLIALAGLGDVWRHQRRGLKRYGE
jgi:hypothetical protein